MRSKQARLANTELLRIFMTFLFPKILAATITDPGEASCGPPRFWAYRRRLQRL
jgi:hypothetical protein